VQDPVLIVAMVLCARGAVRLAKVLTQWIAMRTRIELARIAAALPPGAEVAEQDRHLGSWRFRTTQQPGEARD